MPTQDSVAWSCNNKFEKIWKEGWLKHNELDFSKNLAGWGKEKLEQMELWELRELLSLYLYPQHLLETELEQLPIMRQEFTKFQFITLEELRDNFKNTIISLLDYCQLNMIHSDKIEEIYQRWINYQYHCHKDKIINDIIHAILNNEDRDWSENKLTLVDESLIYYYLRQHNIEIRGYKLNTFPTNTVDLRKYLDYPA